MVIASIDIQNGSVVQLRQGAELALKRDNAEELARTFNRCGEIAVIDLDAAMGKGNNSCLIKPLLRLGECRVGGGVKTVERARELVSLGAKKVIIGSTAFRIGQKFAINTDFLDKLSKAIGRERVVVACDARNGEIVVDGWKTPTGLDLVETARDVEKFAGEILFTCVEREGMLGGTDLDLVQRLRGSVRCLLTVAGGVTTMEEIAQIAALGCDVQLGMALYTGAVNLEDAFAACLNWQKSGGLIPVIAQAPDGQVLMTGYADREALAATFARGNLCFHSRTRNTLWMKGEHSGNTLRVIKLRADCDRDAVLATVDPAGPVCHTGAFSCFETNRRFTFEFLQQVIADRFANPPPGSYTATLNGEKVRKKLMEEAYELCTAQTKAEIAGEAADVFYFAAALMQREGVSFVDVLAELERRHNK